MSRWTEILTTFCEAGRPLGPDGDTYKCETGAPFITFACHQKPEGEVCSSYSQEAEAAEAFKAAFLDYAKGKDRWALYWRRRPVIEENIDDATGKGVGKYSAYARLVLVEIKEKERA